MLPSNRDTVKQPGPPDLAPPDLLGGLAPGVAAALGRAAALAAARGARLWLVGGVVRDLLGGGPLERDVDLAVEGDALALAADLAAALGGRVLASHRAFGTATLSAPCPDAPQGELIFDLAGARAEEYPRPAALPVVRPADIVHDLRRRDFSVNAIAVELLSEGDGPLPGALLDPFGGRADLAAGLLRLLHPGSLRDDPTRLLRGLRLASRLSLAPDEATAAQIAEALERGYLALLTPERVLGELCLALGEPRPDAALALSDAWGATAQIAPGLAWSPQVAGRIARMREAEGVRWAPGLAPPASAAIVAGLLCYDMEADDLAGIVLRYPLPATFTRLLDELAAARAAARELAPDLRPSRIDALLRPFGAATVDVLHYAEPGPAGQIAARYLREIRPARAPLDGRDLQRLGVAPGPDIGDMLDALRAARLDGVATTREQAEGWVRERLR